MTVEEKAGQLVGTYVGQLWGEEKSLADVEREVVGANVGAVSPFGIGVSTRDDPKQAVETANRLQRVAVEETRLGIPLLVPVDAVHGHAYINGATVFPHSIGLAATRSVETVERVGTATAREVTATGATLNYGRRAMSSGISGGDGRSRRSVRVRSCAANWPPRRFVDSGLSTPGPGWQRRRSTSRRTVSRLAGRTRRSSKRRSRRSAGRSSPRSNGRSKPGLTS